jgi:hypothetical protein
MNLMFSVNPHEISTWNPSSVDFDTVFRPFLKTFLISSVVLRLLAACSAVRPSHSVFASSNSFDFYDLRTVLSAFSNREVFFFLLDAAVSFVACRTMFW